MRSEGISVPIEILERCCLYALETLWSHHVLCSFALDKPFQKLLQVDLPLTDHEYLSNCRNFFKLVEFLVRWKLAEKWNENINL